jgi:hypothetical protein
MIGVGRCTIGFRRARAFVDSRHLEVGGRALVVEACASFFRYFADLSKSGLAFLRHTRRRTVYSSRAGYLSVMMYSGGPVA